MTVKSSNSIVDVSGLGKLFVITGVLLLLSACGAQDLWQGGDVKTRASSERNTLEIAYNKDQDREMTDRLNALEGLYIDLMREVKTQNEAVATMTRLMETQKQQSIDADELGRVSNAIRVLDGKMNQALNRISKTEMFLGKSSSRQQQNATPQMIGDGNQFAARIGNYRSEAQVKAAWDKLKSRYSNELSGLTPITSTIEDPTIGKLINLMVGPFASSSDANALCNSLKAKGEPACSVAKYQGKAI
ncbi:SPOR domain-containing protein [Temperatibacter marinus]|uniref:SPOR domain-containing protein n=1 Tax=Temperatibacter marinus TaxID=1456591 RepID=A0AA52ECG3_9PROT|nr:SPOR domain-containing protein [Temperatibacter marinus]WND02160.1 SPOR domain-containing protein [Temperatibacter marinus]